MYSSTWIKISSDHGNTPEILVTNCTIFFFFFLSNSKVNRNLLFLFLFYVFSKVGYGEGFYELIIILAKFGLNVRPCRGLRNTGVFKAQVNFPPPSYPSKKKINKNKIESPSSSDTCSKPNPKLFPFLKLLLTSSFCWRFSHWGRGHVVPPPPLHTELSSPTILANKLTQPLSYL